MATEIRVSWYIYIQRDNLAGQTVIVIAIEEILCVSKGFNIRVQGNFSGCSALE